jgi:cell division topological specificity factor
MLDLISKVFGRGEQTSAGAAKERLRLVLVHDRVGGEPQFLASLKEDLLAVISRYMEVEDADEMIRIETRPDQVALVVDVPVRSMKRAVVTSAR